MTKESTKLRNICFVDIILDKDDIEKFEKILYNILKESMDIQVYIEYSFYQLLKASDILHKHSYVRGSKYFKEESYTFKDTNILIFLAETSNNYMQLTCFKKLDFEYCNNVHAMKKIVTISMHDKFLKS